MGFWAKLAKLVLIPVLIEYVGQGIRYINRFITRKKRLANNKSIREENEKASSSDEREKAAKKIIDNF